MHVINFINILKFDGAINKKNNILIILKNRCDVLKTSNNITQNVVVTFQKGKNDYFKETFLNYYKNIIIHQH